ncbi:hypothetical protein QTO34_000670 [Cnephaeus nilssonii]|uniref:Centromere protein L n=1 Tax=Cnephaeus nilssonii TaxID=3371016 RepID=A0AA40IC18_CNENI|nr:hypothetical protein QTO34_000670 [Eptesicus nilssonii]
MDSVQFNSLYKFSYTNLKEYSKFLSSFLIAEKQKGLAVKVGEDLNIKMIFSTLLGMKATQRDPDAFLVQILSKSQLPSENREGKVLWTGWFCFIFGDSLLETVSEDFICLPLLLANGAETNTALIGTWFQKTFDYHFSPLAINVFNLSWMAAMWTACKMDLNLNSHTRTYPLEIDAKNLKIFALKKMDHYVATTEFLWSVPCSPQSLDISYAIHLKNDNVHKAHGEVTQEEVDLFMDCLCSHFHRHFKIHLSATRLVHVSTSVASAHTNGKIKILCHKYLIGVLAYLTELAIFQVEAVVGKLWLESHMRLFGLLSVLTPLLQNRLTQAENRLLRMGHEVSIVLSDSLWFGLGWTQGHCFTRIQGPTASPGPGARLTRIQGPAASPGPGAQGSPGSRGPRPRPDPGPRAHPAPGARGLARTRGPGLTRLQGPAASPGPGAQGSPGSRGPRPRPDPGPRAHPAPGARGLARTRGPGLTRLQGPAASPGPGAQGSFIFEMQKASSNYGPRATCGTVVGKLRLASHMRLFGPLSVALPQNTTAWTLECTTGPRVKSLSTTCMRFKNTGDPNPAGSTPIGTQSQVHAHPHGTQNREIQIRLPPTLGKIQIRPFPPLSSPTVRGAQP